MVVGGGARKEGGAVELRHGGSEAQGGAAARGRGRGQPQGAVGGGGGVRVALTGRSPS